MHSKQAHSKKWAHGRQVHSQQDFLLQPAWLMGLMLVATPLVAAALVGGSPEPLLAQVTDPLAGLEIPATLPEGSTLRIASSSAMTEVNEALKSRFSNQYAADVTIDYQDSSAALQSLTAGQSDLAAVGRSLNAAEKQQGLIEVPLTRHKIAIVVSPENPFAGSLTAEQFAQIFRGEITNWSEVGGPDLPIVLVDRPATSDTRQAFQNYPVFQAAPFEPAPGAIALTEDSTAAVAAALGTGGIGYAIAEQALNNPALKVVPMHDTLPTDSRYPFSQPLVYVYSSANPGPAALAYLGYATNPENEAIIEQARQAAATAPAAGETPAAEPAPAADPNAAATPAPATTPEPAATPEPAVVGEPGTGGEQAAAPTGRLPWWPWLLALPLLGGLLWWLLARGAAAPVAVAPAVAAAKDSPRLILTPRSCRDAYAYWEIPSAQVEALRQQDRAMLLRLYDVTDIADMDQQTPHSMQAFGCQAVAQGDAHLPIAVDDRDYLAELGYMDDNEQWQAIARSESVRLPACPSSAPQPAAGLGVAAAAAAAVTGGTLLAKTGFGGDTAWAAPKAADPKDQIILVPRGAGQAYAYWELSPQQQATLHQSHQRPVLRIAEVSKDPSITSHQIVRQYDCPESLQDLHVEIPAGNRDYVAELGYTNPDGTWQRLARSQPVHIAASQPKAEMGPAVVSSSQLPNQAAGVIHAENSDSRYGAALAGQAVALGAGAAAISTFLQPVQAGGTTAGGTTASGTPAAGMGVGIYSDHGAESRIILVPRTASEAYAYWEVAPIHQELLRRQGGRQMALRIHNATDLDLDRQPAHSTQEYAVGQAEQDRLVPVLTPNQDYVAELGYLTDAGQWLRLVRSLHVRVPAQA